MSGNMWQPIANRSILQSTRGHETPMILEKILNKVPEKRLVTAALGRVVSFHDSTRLMLVKGGARYLSRS